MSRESKRIKRMTETNERKCRVIESKLGPGCKVHNVIGPVVPNKDGNLRRMEMCEDAIKFLADKPGTTSRFFVTFSEVRRRLGVQGETRAELLAAVKNKLEGLSAD